MIPAPAHDWPGLVRTLLGQPADPLIAIVGPTGSGKTAFSIALSEWISAECGRAAEVINADSRQLYRFLDIGTAKITKGEMRGVPHHLFDVLNPKEEATAAWYQERARRAIADVHGRGNVPVLVGGSMLYVDAVLNGLSFAPAASAEIRARLLAEYEADGGAALHSRLARADPAAAAGIHPRNKPRLVRALEIHEVLGAPRPPTARGELQDRRERPGMLMLGVLQGREALARRIEDRTRAMFAAGWLEEVEDLLRQGYSAADPGMKSHGYREIIAYLEGDSDDLAGLSALISAKTRQYAKRQMTWWKPDARIRWVTTGSLS